MRDITLILSGVVHHIAVENHVYNALCKIIYHVHILNDKAWIDARYKVVCQSGKTYLFKGKDIGTSL